MSTVTVSFQRKSVVKGLERLRWLLSVVAVCALAAGMGILAPRLAVADESPSAVSAAQDPVAILKSLDFQTGTVPLGDNLAEAVLPANFGYLTPADSETFLTRLWGNPPGSANNILGMIVPTDVDVLGPAGWAVVVTYDPSGHVSDDEAGKIDYDDMLRQMQENTRAASQRRVDRGEESIELLGWARKPYYDSPAKKVFWGERLRFGSNQYETLNYFIRILGRRGVLDLNIVSGMDALPAIDSRVQSLLAMTHFVKGSTYEDYNAVTDHAAAYGLAGLIAGGAILAKVGFFKGLLVALLAAKKILIVGALAFFAAMKRFFSRKAK